MRAIYIYLFLFILIFSSCVSKKDKFIANLETVVEYVSQNQDSLTAEMLEVYSSKIIKLKENEFSIYSSKMTIEEADKVNVLFNKYNDLKNRIQIDEFIIDLETVVEHVSQNHTSLTTKMLDIYNSKIILLEENQFLNYRSKMTIEEINEVNLLFGRYDALIIQIHMNEVKNKLKDGLSQGTNMLKELFAK